MSSACRSYISSNLLLISPIPRLYLAHILPMSRPHLAYISPIPHLHLAYISPVSPDQLEEVMKYLEQRLRNDREVWVVQRVCCERLELLSLLTCCEGLELLTPTIQPPHPHPYKPP